MRPKERVRVRVLHHDAWWLALEKPAGMLTVPSGSGRDEDTLYDRARSIAREAKLHHPLSRLDAGVTGVVLFALGLEAIAKADRARRSGSYRRSYHALLPGSPEPAMGAWTAPIGVDPRSSSHRLAGEGRELREARTEYEVRETSASGVVWVELTLKTGRTHQVRVHARAAGLSVLGDDAYGGLRRWVLQDGTVIPIGRVMLHCARVELTHENREFECPWLDDMTAAWQALRGVG